MGFEQINLFDQLKGKSQADRILWHLETHGRITNMQCHELYGIRHAPSVIRDLRKRFERQGINYEIINERKEGCNRWGDPVIWDDYVLVKKDRQASA